MTSRFRTLAALAAMSVTFVAATVHADSFLYVSPASDEFPIGLSPTTYTVYFHSDDTNIRAEGVAVVTFDINVADPSVAGVSSADPTDVLPATGALPSGAGTPSFSGASISDLFTDSNNPTQLIPMMLDSDGNLKVGIFTVTGLSAGTTHFSILPTYIQIGGLNLAADPPDAGTDISLDTGSRDLTVKVDTGTPVPLPSSALAGITLLTLLATRKLATR